MDVPSGGSARRVTGLADAIAARTNGPELRGDAHNDGGWSMPRGIGLQKVGIMALQNVGEIRRQIVHQTIDGVDIGIVMHELEHQDARD